MADENDNCGLRRCINWKQGFLIAIGIPLAIIPSIGLTTGLLWGASILLWGMSVLQGFLQNMAFGELATTFPNASGIPGFAQEIFKSKDGKKRKYDRGKMIGGFCAWAYWFVWAPGLVIFIMIIGIYLGSLFPAIAAMDPMVLNLILSLIILGALALVASRGLKHSARLGLAVAIFTIVPMLIIVIAPFLTGNFHADNITSAWVPADWTWDGDHIMMLLGLIVIAQWSACCWEVVAVYGPEYKKPSKDLPKALFVSGIFCLVMYVLIQISVIGTLGVPVAGDPYAVPLQLVAEASFGSMGATFMILMLIATMIVLIQIGYSAAARAMHSMSIQGNLPRWFAKTNSRGEPMRAVMIVALFNLGLVLMGSPLAILAASAIAYVFAFAIGLVAYVKAKRDIEMAKLERPYKAPRGWIYVAAVLAILQIPFLLIGAVYINNYEYALVGNMIGFGVLAAFFPLWIYSQHEIKKAADKEEAKVVTSVLEMQGK
ncbi:MAG: APC family permease [Methanomassiliicoccales archaeon]|jgi:amino acid transporter